MNIVIANDHCNVAGGASEIAIRQAVLLKQAGVHVVFLAAKGEPDKRLLEANIEVFRTGALETNECKSAGEVIANIWARKTKHTINQICAHLNNAGTAPTILHVHSYTKALTSSVFYYGKQAKWRIAHTVHDYFSACPNGAFYNFKKDSICNIHGLSINCLLCNCDKQNYPNKLFRYLRGAIAACSKALHCVDLVFFLSDSSKKRTQHRFPFARIVSTKNPTAFVKRPFECSVRDSSRPLLYVGQLNPEKAPDTAAVASSISRYGIEIIGAGPMKDQLSSSHPNAIFSGWRNKEYICSALSRAKILLFPSIWLEVQPLVPLEAMALGVTVICNRNSAASESIIHGETGIVLDTNDPAKWADTISNLIESGKWLTLGENAHRWFWQHWPSDDALVESWQKEYTALISSRSSHE